MSKEPEIDQAEYALNLAKQKSNKFNDFIVKCPWLIKKLHIISNAEYTQKWSKITKCDKKINLKIQYNKDVSASKHINKDVKYYCDFDFKLRYAHQPESDAVTFKNMEQKLPKLISNLKCPSYIMNARKLINK